MVSGKQGRNVDTSNDKASKTRGKVKQQKSGEADVADLKSQQH